MRLQRRRQRKRQCGTCRRRRAGGGCGDGGAAALEEERGGIHAELVRCAHHQDVHHLDQRVALGRHVIRSHGPRAARAWRRVLHDSAEGAGVGARGWHVAATARVRAGDVQRGGGGEGGGGRGHTAAGASGRQRREGKARGQGVVADGHEGGTQRCRHVARELRHGGLHHNCLRAVRDRSAIHQPHDQRLNGVGALEGYLRSQAGAKVRRHRRKQCVHFPCQGRALRVKLGIGGARCTGTRRRQHVLDQCVHGARVDCTGAGPEGIRAGAGEAEEGLAARDAAASVRQL